MNAQTDPKPSDEELYAAMKSIQAALMEDKPEPSYPLHLGYAEGMLTVHEDGSHEFQTWEEHNARP